MFGYKLEYCQIFSVIFDILDIFKYKRNYAGKVFDTVTLRPSFTCLTIVRRISGYH